MSTSFLKAREYIAKAREALQRRDKQSAWQFGKRAAQAAPEMEDAWLLLTVSAPRPQQAVVYAWKALRSAPQAVARAEVWHGSCLGRNRSKSGVFLSDKVPLQDMSGPGYCLQDVPWVIFFYDDYGFHGTHWHNNFRFDSNQLSKE